MLNRNIPPPGKLVQGGREILGVVGVNVPDVEVGDSVLVDDEVFVTLTPDTGAAGPSTSTIVVTPSRKRKNDDNDDLDTPRQKRRQTPVATSGKKKGGSEKKIKSKSLITNHFLKSSLVRREGHGGHAVQVPDAAGALDGGVPGSAGCTGQNTYWSGQGRGI